MPERRRLPAGWLLAGILLYALGVSAYFILRYDLRWNEGDSARQNQVVVYVVANGRIALDNTGLVYQHGPTYPALSAFLVEIGGITPQQLTAWIYPLTIPLLALVGFAVYRSLTGSTAAALLASLFLFLQPDFIWVILRGSHEKITWTLVLLAVFLLARSFNARQSLPLLLRYVLLFYLIAFGLVATNVFFASSFIAAMSLAFLGGLLIVMLRSRRMNLPTRDRSQIQRLFYIAVSCSGLLFLLMFYLYPPASFGFFTLQNMVERLAAMLLSFEVQHNPYEYVSATWPSLFTYLALTSFNYFILLSSFYYWIRGIPRYLKTASIRDADLPGLLLWLLYPAFALQLAASALTDLTGIVGGNLQVRLFTPLMLVAIPISAAGLIRQWKAVQVSSRRRVLAVLISLCLAWFSAASLIKSTNEPSLSNQWIFHTAAEEQAAGWLLDHAASARIWTGADERLPSTFEFLFYPHEGIVIDGWTVKSGTRYYFLSDLEEQKILRIHYLLPYLNGENRIYDNGAVRIYHRLPQTAFQK